MADIDSTSLDIIWISISRSGYHFVHTIWSKGFRDYSIAQRLCPTAPAGGRLLCLPHSLQRAHCCCCRYTWCRGWAWRHGWSELELPQSNSQIRRPLRSHSYPSVPVSIHGSAELDPGLVIPTSLFWLEDEIEETEVHFQLIVAWWTWTRNSATPTGMRKDWVLNQDRSL